MSTPYTEYGFPDAREPHMFSKFMPQILDLLGPIKPETRILDVGCGNGYVCGEFLRQGARVVGIDLSEKGLHFAREAYPQGRFEAVTADDHLLENLREEPFDVVVSTEVVEHLHSPAAWARGCFAALKPGGTFICTTPYHGYLKNLLISLAGRWDTHANPHWEGGHIKLWSWKTLSELLRQARFVDLEFHGAGRVPYLWMTMVVKSRRPE